MFDFIAALGLVFAIEGILFAAIPHLAKDALRSAAETPADRVVGTRKLTELVIKECLK